jgi:hypothetical protein
MVEFLYIFIDFDVQINHRWNFATYFSPKGLKNKHSRSKEKNYRTVLAPNTGRWNLPASDFANVHDNKKK